MKASKDFVIVLSSILLVFFLAELACFVYFAAEIQSYIYYIILAQLIAFSIAACCVIVYGIRSNRHTSKGSKQGITRIVLLSESNEPKEEYSLINRTSALIGKRDTVYFRSEIDLAVDGYAVINCVDGYWYVERVFEEKSVGLKRAGEQFVYKLRTGINYQLQINDIIYIANERLLAL